MNISPRASLHDLDGADTELSGETSLLAATLRVHRRTPIERLSTEALRFLLEEGQSSAVLLHIAIGRLERDPLIAGDYYPGDLLVAVLRQPLPTWLAAPELRARAYVLAEDAAEQFERLDPEDRKVVARAIASFKARWMDGGADY
jgi:hypothetical protein